MMALLEVEEEVERQQHGIGMILLLNIIVRYIFLGHLFSYVNILIRVYFHF
jgi:hypothetical protein